MSHVWTFTVVFVKMLKLVIALVKLERSIYRILREKQNLCQSVNQNVCERGAESVPLMTVAGAHLEAGIAVHIGILIRTVFNSEFAPWGKLAEICQFSSC